MRLPGISAIDNKISGRTGELDVYINGQRATETDLAVFWPKDVMRVEYIENPREGGFAGESAVINFVMKTYSMGGIAKADLLQTIRNNGLYGAATTLKYKKMTYGLSLAGSYRRNPDETSRTEEIFRDVFNNGNLYSEIHKTASNRSESKADGVRAVFDAKYAVENLTLAHSVNISNNRTPGVTKRSDEVWVPNIFDADWSETYLTNSLLNFLAQGKYSLSTGKWVFRLNWYYNYLRERNNSNVALGDRPTIVSRGLTHDNSGVVDLTIFRKLNDKWTVTLTSNTAINRTKTDYTGASSQQDIENQYMFTNELRVEGTLSRYVWLILKPGVFADVRKNRGMASVTSCDPMAELELFWTPSNVASFYLNFQQYINTAGGVTSSTLIKVSDFLWHQGNPELKNKPHTWIFGNAVWMPFKRTSFNFDVDYYQESNRDYSYYLPAPAEMGGVIEQRRNAPRFNKFSLAASFQQTLFRGRISYKVGARYRRWHSTGATFRNIDCLNYYGSISARVRNFNFSATYNSPNKDYISGGFGIMRSPRGNLSFGVTYGNSDLFVSARLCDILNTHALTRTQLMMPYYSLTRESLATGRSLMLTLSYTLGYGLKIDDVPEVQNSAGVFSTPMLGIRP